MYKARVYANERRFSLGEYETPEDRDAVIQEFRDRANDDVQWCRQLAFELSQRELWRQFNKGKRQTKRGLPRGMKRSIPRVEGLETPPITDVTHPPLNRWYSRSDQVRYKPHNPNDLDNPRFQPWPVRPKDLPLTQPGDEDYRHVESPTRIHGPVYDPAVKARRHKLEAESLQRLAQLHKKRDKLLERFGDSTDSTIQTHLNRALGDIQTLIDQEQAARNKGVPTS